MIFDIFFRLLLHGVGDIMQIVCLRVCVHYTRQSTDKSFVLFSQSIHIENQVQVYIFLKCVCVCVFVLLKTCKLVNISLNDQRQRLPLIRMSIIRDFITLCEA